MTDPADDLARLLEGEPQVPGTDHACRERLQALLASLPEPEFAFLHRVFAPYLTEGAPFHDLAVDALEGLAVDLRGLTVELEGLRQERETLALQLSAARASPDF